MKTFRPDWKGTEDSREFVSRACSWAKGTDTGWYLNRWVASRDAMKYDSLSGLAHHRSKFWKAGLAVAVAQSHSKEEE